MIVDREGWQVNGQMDTRHGRREGMGGREVRGEVNRVEGKDIMGKREWRRRKGDGKMADSKWQSNQIEQKGKWGINRIRNDRRWMMMRTRGCRDRQGMMR